MEKETIEEKQKYLRENILDNGYDIDKFMKFLYDKKGESEINLDNWSLQELISVTNEFIANNKIFIENNFKNNKNKEDNLNIINDKEEVVPQEKYANCILIEETPISKQNKIEIKVSEPQIEKGGIFSFSYSTYLIKTSPLNLEVRRRYSDFIWLYNILKIKFVNAIVPPFAKRKDKVDKIKMENRVNYIEQFLNNISIHPLLRNSKIFFDFISIQNEKDFIEKKNKYEKMENNSNVKDLKTLNGEIKVSITYENEKYFQNIKDKLNAQDNIFDKLIYNYKILFNNIQQISEKMKEISKIWKELYNQKNEYFESECTSGTYDSLSKVMQEWSELLKKNSSLIKDSIIRFFKYAKEEFSSLKNMYYITENNKNEYYKKKQRLLTAKEQIFSNKEKLEINLKDETEEYIENEKKKEIECSKLMIKDTEIVYELEKEYGGYLNSYIGEYERLRDLHSTRMKKNSFNFIKQLGIHISNYNFSLGEVLAYIDSLTEEGYIGNSNINNEIYNNAVPVAGNVV